MKLLGIILIVGGLIALFYGGFSYWGQSQEFLGIHVQQREFLVVPPIVGALAVIVGVLLLFQGRNVV